MSAMSPLGIIHTAISLVAVGAGLVAFARHHAITGASKAGLLYIVTTVLTCVTSLFIFAHGGFGKPHGLAIVTLLTIGVALAARGTGVFGRAAVAVETVAYSLTFFFHLVPAVTETSTRLPAGAPLIESAESPVLQAISGALFLLFLAGAVWQVRQLRTSRGALPA